MSNIDAKSEKSNNFQSFGHSKHNGIQTPTSNEGFKQTQPIVLVNNGSPQQRQVPSQGMTPKSNSNFIENILNTMNKGSSIPGNSKMMGSSKKVNQVVPSQIKQIIKSIGGSSHSSENNRIEFKSVDEYS